MEAITYVLAGCFVGYILWKGFAPYRLVRGREPVVARRSGAQFEAAMGKTLGRPLTVYLAFVSLCFLGWSLLIAATSPVWGIPLATLVAVPTFFNVRMAFRAFTTRH